MELSTPDLAYMAAVVDVLGLIRVREYNGTVLPVLQMHGNYLPVFEKFGKWTETKVIATKRDYTKAGCAEHCKEKHQHVVSVSARWSVTGQKARIVLEALMPYLTVKQDKAKTVLLVTERARYKAATTTKMRELQKSNPAQYEKLMTESRQATAAYTRDFGTFDDETIAAVDKFRTDNKLNYQGNAPGLVDARLVDALRAAYFARKKKP